MKAGLTIQVRRQPECVIVIVAGEIDVATATRLRDRLNALAGSGRPVIADLDQVSFMDASGLGALVGASRRAAAHGVTLHVVCGQSQIRRLFRLTGLDQHIPLNRTLAEALRAIEGSP
jgi:anti-sigma B factor antagonist